MHGSLNVKMHIFTVLTERFRGFQEFTGLLLTSDWAARGDTAERDIQNKDGHLLYNISANVDCLMVTPVLLEFRLNKWDSHSL